MICHDKRVFITVGNNRKNDSENMCAELKQKKGELKIFLGYSIGTGKTYAMLQAALSLKQHGADVVVGYINPDRNPKTLSMQDGLEVLPTKKLKWDGETIQEFDLDIQRCIDMNSHI